MASIAPSSRGSKASRISKKDRDLEMMAVMAPVIQKRTAQNRDVEENEFNLIVARLVGGLNLLLGLILYIIAAVIYTINCCGSDTQYDKGEFEEQCQTEADKLSGESSGQWSCYYRNLTVLIIFCFALYLTIVAITIVIAGEIFYGVSYTQARQEADLEDLAAELKAQQLQDRIGGREMRRIEREEREYEREQRRQERASRQQAQVPALQPTNRYAGATPYQCGLHRAHSVGAPSTVPTAVHYQTYQTGAPVTYRVAAQAGYGHVRSSISPQRIQIRTSREGVVAQKAPSPVRIRVSREQQAVVSPRAAPSSPGRRTVIQG